MPAKGTGIGGIFLGAEPRSILPVAFDFFAYPPTAMDRAVDFCNKHSLPIVIDSTPALFVYLRITSTTQFPRFG